MWLIGMLLMLAVAFPAEAARDVIKDPDGKTLALLFDCNSCEKVKRGAECRSGVSAGFHDGEACGQCLMQSNFGTRIPYAYDIQIYGKLKDEEGKPLVGEFVRLFLPNTWTVRTRTTADGLFRLLLGATIERQGRAVVLDLGDRTGSKGSEGEYALYMVPEDYKRCEKEE